MTPGRHILSSSSRTSNSLPASTRGGWWHNSSCRKMRVPAADKPGGSSNKDWGKGPCRWVGLVRGRGWLGGRGGGLCYPRPCTYSSILSLRTHDPPALISPCCSCMAACQVLHGTYQQQRCSAGLLQHAGCRHTHSSPLHRCLWLLLAQILMLRDAALPAMALGWGLVLVPSGQQCSSCAAAAAAVAGGCRQQQHTWFLLLPMLLAGPASCSACDAAGHSSAGR
jgi:hypothetical protein